MLYVDAHRPNDLDKLHYHHDLSKRIRALAGTGQDFPHLLVYGPSGAGKKTRIMCTLKELYGKGVEKVRYLACHAGYTSAQYERVRTAQDRSTCLLDSFEKEIGRECCAEQLSH